ncbi:MAG TPA: magnesium/cobalt transporter CorA [Ignavibacteria bacterium]|nr:magnesium/cobalt transporter CorA [Ignavibacteria bacterium]HMQ99873.1 magnesium/cobalt transporter CorA [Ignavibacteria bacterium]
MQTPKVIKKPYIKLRKLFRPKKKAAGLPPGTAVYTGDVLKGEKVIVNLIDYKGNLVNEKEITDPKECSVYTKKDTISWIDVDGIHDVALVQSITDSISIHPLVVEDILNVEQRAKMEEYDGYIYLVLKMFHLGKTDEIIPEQVSIILSKNYVVTFQEGVEGDTFQEIRNRIRNNKGIINSMTSDYLVYSIIDSIIDSYFTILEVFGDRIERLEEELVNNPQKRTLTEIYRIKREMLYIRKSIWPLREAISRLERGESELVSRNTHLYLRDVYDHTINVLDTIETYRDMLSGMIDIYLSSISNRLNETMKYLALISTIFIPMTFIASIYGMNFELMPELKWAQGYWFALSLMAAIGIGFYIYFKKKKWV